VVCSGTNGAAQEDVILANGASGGSAAQDSRALIPARQRASARAIIRRREVNSTRAMETGYARDALQTADGQTGGAAGMILIRISFFYDRNQHIERYQ